MQMRQCIQRGKNIPEGFSFKKKKGCTPAGLFLPSFWDVYVFLSGLPLAIVFLVSFSLFSHTQLEQERRLRPSDPTLAIRHAFGLQWCLFFCQFFRAPWVASKAILQLSCWHKTAFHSSHCQISWVAHSSALSLRKQDGISLSLSRSLFFSLTSSRAHPQLRVWSSLAECVLGTSHMEAAAGRFFSECSRDPPVSSSSREPRLPLLPLELIRAAL